MKVSECAFITLHRLMHYAIFSSRTLRMSEGDLLLDFSKNLINDEIFKALLELVSRHRYRLVFACHFRANSLYKNV